MESIASKLRKVAIYLGSHKSNRENIMIKLDHARHKMNRFFNFDNGWYSGKDEEGKETWNNFSGALEELKEKMSVGPAEVTLLSLSKGFGPTPLLDDTLAKEAMKKLWPTGNKTGIVKSPDSVIEKISEILQTWA